MIVKNGKIIVLLAAAVLCFGSCAKVKQIRPTSIEVEAVKPQGLRSVVAFVALGIDNPAMQIALSDIGGEIFHSGKVLGRVAVDPFTLKARTSEVYHLRAVVTLSQERSLLDLMSILGDKKLMECTVDVTAKGRLKGGLSKTIRLKDVPVSKFYELFKR